MVKHLLLFIVPAVVFGAVMLGLSEGKSNEVVHVSAGNGFAEAYTITASPSFRWEESHKTGLIILAYALFACVAIYSYVADENAKQVNLPAVVIAYVIAAICILGPYSFNYYKIKQFQKTISKGDYEGTKSNLDINFEKP